MRFDGRNLSGAFECHKKRARAGRNCRTEMLDIIKRNLKIIGIAVLLGGAAYGVIRLLILISRSLGGVI